MRKRIYFLLPIGLLIISLFFFSRQGRSYDDQTTHPGLTDEIVDFYNLSFGEKLSGEEKEWIVAGSIEEDLPPRWINHFYDPLSGEGWTGEKLGWIPTATMQLLSKILFNLNTDIVSSLNWLHNEALQAKYANYGGNNTWENGIRQYTQGNKREAYKILGHVLHLMEDKTVPDHTRNDTHAHEGSSLSRDGGSPYEEYGKTFTRETLKLAEQLKSANRQPVILGSPDDYIKSLSVYSNKYFFSEDTINSPKYVNPKILRRDDKYGFGKDIDGKEFPLSRVKRIFDAASLKFIFVYSLVDEDNKDFTVLSAYFSRLSSAAVLNGAGLVKLFKDEAVKAEKDARLIKPAPKVSWWQQNRSLAYGTLALFNEVTTAYRNVVGQPVLETARVAVNTANQTGYALANVVGQTAVLGEKIITTAQKPVTSNDLLGANPVGATGGLKVILPPTGGTEQPATGEPQTIITPVQPAQQHVAFSPGDISAPDTAIQSSPNALSSSSQASFVFGANEAGVTYEYDLDNAGWLAVSKDLNLAGLAEGDHVLKVRAADGAGNVDLSPAEFSWQIDLTAPTVTIAAAPAAFASSTSADFQFNASEADASLSCDLDAGGPQTCSASTTLSGLSEGDHRLQIVAADLAGNTGSSTEYLWQIDLTAPTAALNALDPEYAATGFTVSWNGFDVATTSPQPSPWQGEGEGSFDLEYSINSGARQPWLAATTATSSVFNEIVNQGDTIAFRVRAIDRAGNISVWSDVRQTKITLPPPAPVGADHLVISEIQVADSEFVELFNPTDQDVSLAGWHFAYFSPARTAWDNPYRDKEFPAAVIGAHKFYLIGFTNYPTSGASLNSDWQPYADLLSNTAGAAAIFSGSPATSTLVDALGWGAAGLKEGSAAAVPAAGQSLERKATDTSTAESMGSGGTDHLAGNGYDSDDNAADFILKPLPTPHNSTAPAEPRELRAADLALDSTSGTSGDWTNRLAWQHNVGTADACLFVAAHWMYSNYGVDSITYNGRALAPAVTNYAGSQVRPRTAIWYLSDPDAGDHEIEIRWGGNSPFAYGAAVSVAGCDRSQPVDNTYSRYAGADVVGDTVGVQSDHALVLEAISINGNEPAAAPASGQTTFFQATADNPLYELSSVDGYTFVDSAGSYFMQWQLSRYNTWSHSLVVVRGK